MKNIFFILLDQSEFANSLIPVIQENYILSLAYSVDEVQGILNDSKPDLVLIDLDFSEKERLFEILENSDWESFPKMFFGNNEEELIALMDRGLGEIILKSESPKMIFTKIKKMILEQMEIQRDKLALDRFKAIADFSSNLETFRDTNNNVIYCSPSVERILGYSPDEYINKLPVHPDDLHIVKDAFEILMSGKTDGSRIFRMIHKNGEPIWFEVTAEIVYSEKGEFVGYRNSARDITPLKNIEFELKESEARYRLISDYSANWEVYRDINGKLVYSSPAVERILGYTVEEYMKDPPFTDYIHHEDVDRALTDLKNLMMNKSVLNKPYRFIRKNGEVFYLEINAQAVYSDDNVCYGFRLSGRDVTEKIELAKELQKTNATRDKFFSIISHDLRSPFNALIGFSELLCQMGEGLTSGERQEYAQIINNTAKNTLSLLDNLLLWSSSQSSEIVLNLEKVDLNTMVNSAFSFSFSAAQKKKIQLINHLTSGLFVKADVNMLNTILRNLISNAIKYTHNEGMVSISADVVDGFAEINIADNGIGMSEQVKKSLFSIDLNQSTLGTDSEQGTGLGLVLCKEFVEKQSGKIWVESEVGKGSVFKFTLPLFIENVS